MDPLDFLRPHAPVDDGGGSGSDDSDVVPTSDPDEAAALALLPSSSSARRRRPLASSQHAAIAAERHWSQLSRRDHYVSRDYPALPQARASATGQQDEPMMVDDEQQTQQPGQAYPAQIISSSPLMVRAPLPSSLAAPTSFLPHPTTQGPFFQPALPAQTLPAPLPVTTAAPGPSSPSRVRSPMPLALDDPIPQSGGWTAAEKGKGRAVDPERMQLDEDRARGGSQNAKQARDRAGSEGPGTSSRIATNMPRKRLSSLPPSASRSAAPRRARSVTLDHIDADGRTEPGREARLLELEASVGGEGDRMEGVEQGLPLSTAGIEHRIAPPLATPSRVTQTPSLTQHPTPPLTSTPRRPPIATAAAADDDPLSSPPFAGTLEMERAPTQSPAPSADDEARGRQGQQRPGQGLLTSLLPTPGSTASSLDAPLLAGAAAPAGAAEGGRDPSLSPRSAQELATAIAAIDAAAGAVGDRPAAGARALRQRTSLQLNPYTRERALYRHLLARGGLQAAIVQRREEQKAQAAGAGSLGDGGSFEPPPEPVRREERRSRPAGEGDDDELDLLSPLAGAGADELAMWDTAVRKRKKDAESRRRREARRAKKDATSAAQKENRAPAVYVPPEGLLEHEDDRDAADYSAFGLHRSASRPGSTSPSHPRKKQRRQRAPSASSSGDASSDSGQSINTDDEESGRRRQLGLDKKRAKILGRMMPAVAANRHLETIRRAAAERERARIGGGGGRAAAHDGPVRAGQSVVRRAPNAAAKPLMIEGDSESSDDPDRLAPDEALARNSAGHHQRLNALLDTDSIDPDVVAAMYPGEDLLSDGDSLASGGTIELLDDDNDESESEPAQGDIREWLKLPPSAAKATSVVDLMLRRTKAKARSTGGGGGEGTRRAVARTSKASRPLKHAVGRSPARRRASDSPHQVPQARAQQRARSMPKQRPIRLDDDSIYGDVAPRPAGRRLPARPRTGTFLPRPAARRGLPGPRLRNPPIAVPRAGAHAAAAENPFPDPIPLGAAALAAQGVAGPRLPAAQYAPPLPPLAPSSPVRTQTAVGALEGTAWSAYEGFSLDFDIRPLKPGLLFPAESDIRRGRLEDFLGLLRTSVDQLLPPLPDTIQTFGVQLDPGMSFAEFQQVFQILADRLFECADPEGEIAVDTDVKRETTDLDDAWAATAFTCAFATARQTDENFEDGFFAPVFDTLDHLLERLETLSTPTTTVDDSKVFFRLHLFALELLVRLSLVSSSVAEQVKDSLLKVAEVLVRRLLEYGFNRTIKSIKTASQDEQDDGCVMDYTAELWVWLIHVFGQLANVPGALPLDATLASLITSASAATGFPSQGLLAAERLWYLVQGLSAISQFSAAGKVHPNCLLPAQWPLLIQAVAAVKLESDVVTDKLASSTALAKRDKYVWTVLGRCHLMASRWGWKFDVHDTLIGLLCQKVFKNRGFVKLHSDPTSDFPLFLRESNEALMDEVDDEGDSAFDVFLKILHLAVRDFQASAQAGLVPVKQSERAVSRLLAISAPVGRTPFTRKTPPTLRELSTLINRYSFTMVAVYLNPSAENAAHSLRLSQSFLDFDAADFKSRKICIRAAMYLAVLHRHFTLDLSAVADWLGQMTERLLKEYTLVSRANGGAAGTQLAPPGEIIWCLSMVLGSIRHIIGSRGMDGQASVAYPDPALLHKSWTVGILSSALAFEPIAGAEVLQCVQAFLDARRAALASVAAINQQQQPAAGESQDEFAFEFAPMDFDDPSLRLLLGEAEPAPDGAPHESAADAVARQDKVFADIIAHTVSPAIYRLLSNMLTGDAGWLRMLGGGEPATAPAEAKADRLAREAYVARIVDCWAGCAAVLVQHQLKDWSSYVELGTESYKRFGSFGARRQVGMRFLWNVVCVDPSSFKELREDFLSIWFQTIIAPSSTWTVEPDLTSQLFELDADQPGSLFGVVPFRRAQAGDGEDEGAWEVSGEELEAKRGQLLDEVFTTISIEVSRPATGDVPLQQRKAFLISLVRDMLLSLSDFYQALEGDDKRAYARFALDVVGRLEDRSGAWLNERTLRELAYWRAMREGLRAAAARGVDERGARAQGRVEEAVLGQQAM